MLAEQHLVVRLLQATLIFGFYLAEPGYQVDEGDGFLEVKVRKIGTDLSQPSSVTVEPVPSLQKSFVNIGRQRLRTVHVSGLLLSSPKTPEVTKSPKTPKSTQVDPSRPKSTQVNPSRPKSTQVDPSQPKSTQVNPSQPKSTQSTQVIKAIQKRIWKMAWKRTIENSVRRANRQRRSDNANEIT
ncbi:hypothetical protein DPMN_106507 [Dreissena polymorpha]|uniref:Uncharacterized protein n=1 Tax=Dreissena polymorpha TaxID=45954 RepID=A0A9D4QIY8_DREPO|nr:hypothetical protein DPMN_106507 [Dreissena polymorpha]